MIKNTNLPFFDKKFWVNLELKYYKVPKRLNFLVEMILKYIVMLKFEKKLKIHLCFVLNVIFIGKHVNVIQILQQASFSYVKKYTSQK